MFFVCDFSQKIHLGPNHLGPNIQVLVKDYLLKNIEGSCCPSGYIIAVLGVDDMSDGRVLLTGQTIFTVRYKALVMRPMKDEIVDANVVEVSKMGVFASVGPLTIFISNHQMPDTLSDGEMTVNTALRLKIIGIRIDSSKVYAVGTINDDSLGVIC